MRVAVLFVSLALPCALTLLAAEPLPQLKLGHYAQSTDIKFTGRSLAEHERDILAFLKLKHPKLDLNAPEGKRLVRGMALMVKDSSSGNASLVGRYYNQVIDAYNAYPALAEAIEASFTPPAFKIMLKDYYAILMIERGLRLDLDAEIARLASIPAQATLIALDRQKMLATALREILPAFDALAPHAKKKIYDYMASFNPDLKVAGWYRTTGALVET